MQIRLKIDKHQQRKQAHGIKGEACHYPTTETTLEPWHTPTHQNRRHSKQNPSRSTSVYLEGFGRDQPGVGNPELLDDAPSALLSTRGRAAGREEGKPGGTTPPGPEMAVSSESGRKKRAGWQRCDGRGTTVTSRRGLRRRRCRRRNARRTGQKQRSHAERAGRRRKDRGGVGWGGGMREKREKPRGGKPLGVRFRKAAVDPRRHATNRSTFAHARRGAMAR